MINPPSPVPKHPATVPRSAASHMLFISLLLPIPFLIMGFIVKRRVPSFSERISKAFYVKIGVVYVKKVEGK